MNKLRIVTGSVFAVVLSFVAVNPAHAATVASYNMDNATTMTDSSGFNNHGKTTAITTVTGTSGLGYRFNGTSSRVDVPNSASLNPGTKSITMTARVKTAGFAGTSVDTFDIVRKGLSGTTGGHYKMEIMPTDSTRTTARAHCVFQDAGFVTGDVKSATTTNIADNRWHTITCRKTATQVSLTLDGVTTTRTISLGSISNVNPLRVGVKETSGGDWYKGDMDQVSIATL